MQRNGKLRRTLLQGTKQRSTVLAAQRGGVLCGRKNDLARIFVHNQHGIAVQVADAEHVIQHSTFYVGYNQSDAIAAVTNWPSDGKDKLR